MSAGVFTTTQGIERMDDLNIAQNECQYRLHGRAYDLTDAGFCLTDVDVFGAIQDIAKEIHRRLTLRHHTNEQFNPYLSAHFFISGDNCSLRFDAFMGYDFRDPERREKSEILRVELFREFDRLKEVGNNVWSEC